MEQKPRIVALIPLRGGSKSIPDKNIKEMAGMPLCFYALKAATEAKLVNDVYVSTDSGKISTIVSGFKMPLKILKREECLATDESSTEAVILDFMKKIDFDILLTAQATSPLMASSDINFAISYFLEGNYDSLLTGVRIKRFFWLNGQPLNYNPKKRPRRQDFEGCLMENGAFYITKREVLEKEKCRLGGKIGIYEMPAKTANELDELSDWKVVEDLLIAEKLKNKKFILKDIKMLLMDFDGVLTDSYVSYDMSGQEQKRFCVRDGMGIEMLRDAGIKTGIISREKSPIIDYRAKKLKIDFVYQGTKDKVKSIMEISKKSSIPLRNIAFIGDDINDLEALKIVGFSAVPRNSVDCLKSIVDYICLYDGGKGCIREICDLIITVKNFNSGSIF